MKLNRGGFPLRPGKQHCPSYLRTAFCPLMKACMMHHPNLLMEAPAADAPVDTGKADAEKPKRGKTFEHDKMEVVEEGDWTAGYPQHPKAAVCETFMRFGGCECVPLATSPRAAVSQLRACCLDTREPGFINSVLDCAAIVCTCDLLAVFLQTCPRCRARVELHF